MNQFFVRHSKLFSILFLLPVFLFVSQTAHAAAAWEDALQKVVDILTGNTARLLAGISVIGFGVSAFFGRVSYRRAGEIILGISIVFGAFSIVDMFIGQ